MMLINQEIMECEACMVKRCDHCIYFMPTVFSHETDSGYACWNGYCLVQDSEKHGGLSSKRVQNLYYACEEYFTPIPKLKGWSWKWTCWWNFIDILEFLKVDLSVFNVTIDFSDRFRLISGF